MEPEPGTLSPAPEPARAPPCPQVERVQKVGGLYSNFTSEQSLGYLDGTLPGDFGFDPLGKSLFWVFLVLLFCFGGSAEGLRRSDIVGQKAALC